MYFGTLERVTTKVNSLTIILNTFFCLRAFENLFNSLSRGHHFDLIWPESDVLGDLIRLPGIELSSSLCSRTQLRFIPRQYCTEASLSQVGTRNIRSKINQKYFHLKLKQSHFGSKTLSLLLVFTKITKV